MSVDEEPQRNGAAVGRVVSVGVGRVIGAVVGRAEGEDVYGAPLSCARMAAGARSTAETGGRVGGGANEAVLLGTTTLGSVVRRPNLLLCLLA
jgi:hypothetical protein